MKFREYENIIQMIEHAKLNKGLCYLSNRPRSNKPVNATSQLEAFQTLFDYDFNMTWLLPKLFVSKSKSNEITQKQRKELKRLKAKHIDEDGLDHMMSFSLYELFQIPEDEQKPESLDFYMNFFKLLHSEQVKNNNAVMLFINENNPIKLGVRVEENQDLQNKIETFINEQKHKAFWKSIAIGLSVLGRYSSFMIRDSGILSFDEAHSKFNYRVTKRKELKNKKES